MSENDETTNLARRAVACPAWRWMRGMTDEDGRTVICVKAKIVMVASDTVYPLVRQRSDTRPNLADPATLGCLLALVREALSPTAFVAPGMGRWICFAHPVGTFDGETEAEALVAALVAAPEAGQGAGAPRE